MNIEYWIIMIGLIWFDDDSMLVVWEEYHLSFRVSSLFNRSRFGGPYSGPEKGILRAKAFSAMTSTRCGKTWLSNIQMSSPVFTQQLRMSIRDRKWYESCIDDQWIKMRIKIRLSY